MRRVLILFTSLFLVLSVFSISVSAEESSDTSVVYPDFNTYQLMVKKFPTDNDSHVIGFDLDHNVCLYAWDSSDTSVVARPYDTSVSDYGLVPSSVLNEYDPGTISIYYWDSENYNWTFDSSTSGEWLKGLHVPRDFLIYSDVDVPFTTEGIFTAFSGQLVGVKTPVWYTLTYENTFKDLPQNLMKEIVSILPIVIVFLVFAFAIYKGIRFLFSLLRSA